MSYLVSLVAACVTAGALAVTRSSHVLGYLIALTALVGPEVSGQLGTGHPPLGSVRLVDAATLSAALTALTAVWPPRVRNLAFGRWTGLALLTVGTIGYASIRWGIEGHHIDRFLRSDLRLVALGALFWLITTICRNGGARMILWSVPVVGVLAAAKAAAIHISGVYAIGSFDRLQASNYYAGGHLRTILVGGDTLLILVPVVALLLASGTSKRIRLLLGLAGLFSLWALGLSATRTSLLVSLGLVLAGATVMLIHARPRLTRSTVVATCVIGALGLAIAIVGGAASRLTQHDPPHVGLNFRKDEIDSFLRTTATTKYLGQGLGGRFLGKDVNGTPTLSGWAHELPVWISLKAGILGLLAATFALATILWRAVKCLRARDKEIQALAGALLVIGLVAMSMTLDRLALPEGMPLLIVGVFLTSSPRRHLDSTDV